MTRNPEALPSQSVFEHVIYDSGADEGPLPVR